MSESLFIKVALCFPMNIAKFLRTTFLRKTSIGLLLHGYLVKEICKCFFLVFFHSLRLFFWYLNQTSIFFLLKVLIAKGRVVMIVGDALVKPLIIF